MAFRVGQKVTPKNSDPWEFEDDGAIYPQFGVVYTVRATDWEDGEQFLWLCEIVNVPHEYEDSFGEQSFDADEFRPVTEKKNRHQLRSRNPPQGLAQGSGARMMDHRTTSIDAPPNGHPGASDDVWIEVVAPNCAVGDSGRFFGMATLSMPYGPNGPCEARVGFNLSGYIRHEIAKASAVSGDRSQADANSAGEVNQ